VIYLLAYTVSFHGRGAAGISIFGFINHFYPRRGLGVTTWSEGNGVLMIKIFRG